MGSNDSESIKDSRLTDDRPKRRLKGRVTVSRTIQTKKFEPASLTLCEEYWVDEISQEEIIRVLTARLNRWFEVS